MGGKNKEGLMKLGSSLGFGWKGASVKNDGSDAQDKWSGGIAVQASNDGVYWFGECVR